jgi:hypothetical protein
VVKPPRFPKKVLSAFSDGVESEIPEQDGSGSKGGLFGDEYLQAGFRRLGKPQTLLTPRKTKNAASTQRNSESQTKTWRLTEISLT